MFVEGFFLLDVMPCIVLGVAGSVLIVFVCCVTILSIYRFGNRFLLNRSRGFSMMEDICKWLAENFWVVVGYWVFLFVLFRARHWSYCVRD